MVSLDEAAKIINGLEEIKSQLDEQAVKSLYTHSFLFAQCVQRGSEASTDSRKEDVKTAWGNLYLRAYTLGIHIPVSQAQKLAHDLLSLTSDCPGAILCLLFRWFTT